MKIASVKLGGQRLDFDVELSNTLRMSLRVCAKGNVALVEDGEPVDLLALSICGGCGNGVLARLEVAN